MSHVLSSYRLKHKQNCDTCRFRYSQEAPPSAHLYTWVQRSRCCRARRLFPGTRRHRCRYRYQGDHHHISLCYCRENEPLQDRLHREDRVEDVTDDVTVNIYLRSVTETETSGFILFILLPASLNSKVSLSKTLKVKD